MTPYLLISSFIYILFLAYVVWPRLLFQLSLEMARHVLYGPAPKRSTNGIWRVSSPFPSFPFLPYRASYTVRGNGVSSHHPHMYMETVIGKAEGSPHDF